MVNDSYGHQIGDEVLKNLAEILKVNFRKNDIIGRRGGDELMIILPNTDIPQAMDKATAIKEIVEKNLSLNKSLDDLKITVSIGVTQVEKGDNHEILMIKADTALYKCKTDGRNKVRVQLYSPKEVCKIDCLECPHVKNCIKNKTT